MCVSGAVFKGTAEWSAAAGSLSHQLDVGSSWFQKVALIVDIQAMFHQVEVSQKCGLFAFFMVTLR